MDERRNAVRWNVFMPVRYLDLPDHKEGYAHTKDLSMKGAQIETVERHKVGDVVDMMLDLPGAQGSMCVEAAVVWQRPSCSYEECNYLTGLEFRKIRDCHKQAILDFVIDSKPDQVQSRWWDGVK